MNGARGCLTAILILVSFVLLIFWLGGWVGFTYEWNTKLTLTINTPDGERSGSTVRYSYSSPGCLHGYCMDEEGEAVVVHLDNDRYLFALDGLTWRWLMNLRRKVA